MYNIFINIEFVQKVSFQAQHWKRGKTSGLVENLKFLKNSVQMPDIEF